MATMDWIGLITSFVYAFGMLTLFETLGKKKHISQFVTRKLTHIFAGLWTWGVLILFEHRVPGLIPYATFIVLNYLFYRKQTYSHMDTQDSTPGTIYFALSITLCFAFLWYPNGPQDHISIAMASIMTMTLGDAMAALLGKHYGKRTYRIWDIPKTFTGSAAMFVSSALAILLTLTWLPESSLAPFETAYSFQPLLFISLFAAAVATAIEAVTPKGLDNLTVPLSTCLILYALL